MKIDTICLNKERNVTLTVWGMEVDEEIGSIEKRPAILVLPGGGYSVCSDREADPVAAAYLKAGYQVFILRYSVGKHMTWPNPLNDYEQAMEMIRGNANRWRVDKERVAVVGFSAGGHLAACAATMSKNRPNAAILGYAALKKEICDMCQPGMPYPVDCVDAETSACFLFATRNDMIVDISNTLDFEKALVEKGISFESHIYSYGDHGISTGEKWLNEGRISKRAENWVDDSIEWLEEIWGAFEAKGFTAPVLDRIINANYAKTLSADCTVGYLKSQSSQVQEILGEAFVMLDHFIKEKFPDFAVAKTIAEGNKLSAMLQMLQIPEDKILKLDAKLKELPNNGR